MANLGDKDLDEAGRDLRDDADELVADEVLEEEQLTLADEEERLPWLESDDEEEESGIDTGFIATIALIGLLLILMVLAIIWWFGREETSTGPVADGSTITAPEEPYKTRPDDPGGTDVAGTGDLSFEQGEGETRESRIGSPDNAGDATPAPGFSGGEDGSEEAASATSGVGVQVGAYSSREKAQEGWSTLQQRFDVLGGVNRRILEAQVDGATVYRLQAVASDADAARTLCNAIKAGGGDCQVKN